MRAAVKIVIAVATAAGFAGSVHAMMPASTKGGGTSPTPGPLDVVKTPAAPSPIPVPYPNVGKRDTPMPRIVAPKVRIENKPALPNGGKASSSNGDEAGTLKGVLSNKNMSGTEYKQGSSRVKSEGKVLLTPLGSMTGHNGANSNAPPGSQVAPSQTKVLVAP